MTSLPLEEPELDHLRELFGDATEPLALARFERRPGLWVALSGAPTPDYNMTLVHGGDVVANTRRAMDALLDNDKQPGIVLLAGPGLQGRDTLTTRGWRHVRTMPFMQQHGHEGPIDEGVVPVTLVTMEEARSCLAEAFHQVPEAMSGLLNEKTLQDDGVEAVCIHDDAGLAGVNVITWGRRAAAGWSLGVRPRARRSHTGVRLVTYASRRLHQESMSGTFLATPGGRRINEALGATWLEDWEIWSRPRWLMPSD